MKQIKDVYKLKRFGTYVFEIDTDDVKAIQSFGERLRKHLRWRFIKFILVPAGTFKVMEIKEIKKPKGKKDK